MPSSPEAPSPAAGGAAQQRAAIAIRLTSLSAMLIWAMWAAFRGMGYGAGRDPALQAQISHEADVAWMAVLAAWIVSTVVALRGSIALARRSPGSPRGAWVASVAFGVGALADAGVLVSKALDAYSEWYLAAEVVLFTIGVGASLAACMAASAAIDRPDVAHANRRALAALCAAVVVALFIAISATRELGLLLVLGMVAAATLALLAFGATAQALREHAARVPIAEARVRALS